MAKTNAEFMEAMEEKNPDEVLKDIAEDLEQEPEEQPEKAEQPDNAPREAVKEIPSDVKDGQYYANLRRERKEAARKAAEATQPIRPPVAPQIQAPAPIQNPTVPQDDPEPQYDGTVESKLEVLEWRDRQRARQFETTQTELKQFQDYQTQTKRAEEQRQTFNGAIQQYQSIENQYRRKNPEYDAAFDMMSSKIIDSYRTIYPAASEADITQAALTHIIQEAGKLYNEGLDPAEEFFYLAQERYGYGSEPKPKTSNLRVVESNKRKSLTPLSGGGRQGDVLPTVEEAAKMSNADFMNLPPEMMRRA